MAAGANDRTARTAGALGGAIVLAALGVLLSSGSQAGLAALGAVVGLVAGLALALAGPLPARPRRHSLVERLNDGAFVVVLSAVSLLLAITARPWTAAIPGLVGGFLAGLYLRPAPNGDRQGPGSGGAGPAAR
jgi:membrane associated rhomboid family serine protease